MSPTPEDLLRDALRDDSPVGAGSFDDVRTRAGKLDRRSRLLKAGAAVVVVLAAIGIAVPLLAGDDNETQRVITQPSPQTTVARANQDPIAIWPYVSAAEADDEHIDPGFDTTDPFAVATRFLSVFAGMNPDSVDPADSSGREVNVVATHGNLRTILALRKLGTSERWTVVSVKADDLVVDSPGAGQRVASPLHVEGRATAFEGSVLVKVTDRAKTPNELGKAGLTGEMGLMKPFNGDVPFQPGEMSVGAVIAYTVSAKDGSIEQVAAVPVVIR